MAIYRNLHTIFNVSEATSEAQTGSTYQVRPSDADAVSDAQQLFRVFLDLSQSGGSESPTTDLYVETSHDGSHWVVVAQATQLTADGEGHEFKEVEIGPYVRARTALGGTTPPDHTAKVVLASTSPFSIAKK